MSSAYEDQKIRARDPDPKVRRALAADSTTAPELLYFLAEDEDAEVRRLVARNDATPRHADLLLTKDADDQLRGELAQKVAKLTPDLPDDKRSTLYKLTIRALEALAEDQIVRVREILADTLKDVANAPTSVILTLARDSVLSVASPVLEFSPVLSDKDLLDIIQSSSVQGAMGAIARRKALTESLSEAIVRSGDDDAVSELLGNKSAQIREDTLDMIIDRAPGNKAWHEPLVLRPTLSPKAVQRIATFVAMNLLDRLQKRLDLDDETLVAVAHSVEQRIAAEGRVAQEAIDDTELDDMDDRINRKFKAGTLNGESIERALASGERRFVVKALAKLAGVDYHLIDRVVSNRSAKGIVAITWKAGLRQHLAGQLQTQLVGLSPKEAIRMNPDRWPMTPEAMQWQLDFHSEISDGAKG